jgi:16S rRNA (guanine966-N2)-methyltransferase
MRVIAGFLGGRNFSSPPGHRTHPMSEKVRGRVFGVLGDIKGLTVLDAFAGSGALGIEAISRGAKSVLAVEVDKNAHRTITENCEAFGISDRLKAVRAFFNAWSTRHQSQLFDLVFADPPYNDVPWRDMDVLPRHLKDEGTLVLSWPGNAEVPRFKGLAPIRTKDYGDAQLVFYQKNG